MYIKTTDTDGGCVGNNGLIVSFRSGNLNGIITVCIMYRKNNGKLRGLKGGNSVLNKRLDGLIDLNGCLCVNTTCN